MSARPWYRRYGGDFVMGTMALSLEEKGAYSLCLDLIYDRGGPIPDDARYLAGVCGVSVRKWRALRDSLIAAGKLIARDGCLTNSRAEIELEDAARTARKLAENGVKGGNKRAENAGERREINKIAEAGPKPTRGLPFPEPDKKETQADACVERARAPTPKRAQPRSRIPDGWEPSDVDRAFARDRGLTTAQIAEEAAKMVDWALNAPPDKALKSDWSAAWRNWIRNVVERSGRGPPAQRQNPSSSPNGYAPHDLRNHPNSVVAAADRLQERIRDFEPRPESLGEGAAVFGGPRRG